MWRGKSSWGLLLWWSILKRSLPRGGLAADVYAEREKERKRGREREGGRGKGRTEHGEKHRKAEAVGRFAGYTTDEPQNEQKLPKPRSSNK